jgi:putative membrane protein
VDQQRIPQSVHGHLMMIAMLHAGRPLAPHDVWSAWSFDPLVLIALVISAWLYGRGVQRLWRRAGRGRGIRVWQAAAFTGGWFALFVAMVSPLHRMGEVLFSAHMTQHEILMVVAAPLLVLSRPLVPSLFALPMPWRRALGRIARTPAVRSAWLTVRAPACAWLAHAAALWLWHLPGPYQATLASDAVHTFQHVSFLGTALVFWWSLLYGRERRLSYGSSVFYLFTTTLHTGGLGALLTFAAAPWYQSYDGVTQPWGLTALEDQQLAGLIMWVPASLGYLAAALWLMAAWLKESEQRAVRWRASIAGSAAMLALLMIAGCGMGPDKQTMRAAAAMTGGDPTAGARKIRRYGCGSCHTIPGISGANRLVGPPLDGIASRMYIAGVLPNEPHNMTTWIMNPPGVDSMTAMPNLGVTAQDASDIAAYLYTLK